MTELRDPPRWTRGSDAPAGFDDLVSADQALGPDAQALHKLFAGVAAELGRPELPAALEQELALKSTAAGMTWAAKIAVGLAVVALAVGAAYRSTPDQKVSALKAQPAPAPAAVLAPAPPASFPPPPAASPEQPRQPPPAHPQRTRVEPSDEFTLLDRAQRALEASPAAALGLAEQHRRQFAHGALAQEREVLAIEALTRMGRLAAAQRRAATFLRVYPDSSHRVRVETMLRTVR